LELLLEPPQPATVNARMAIHNLEK
jgi:hypothetical protein